MPQGTWSQLPAKAFKLVYKTFLSLSLNYYPPKSSVSGNNEENCKYTPCRLLSYTATCYILRQIFGTVALFLVCLDQVS